MKEQSHKSMSFDPGVLAALLALLFLCGPAPRSAAQTSQDSRQLNREKAQQENRVSQRRVALVIGNGAYTSGPPLKNPPNDARAMAVTLKALGFEVSSGINANQREMKRLIREFGQKLKAGGSGVFYYAGHGVQSNGRNYLIPVDADIQSEAEVEDSSVDVNLVLHFIDEARNGLNIVILDACRNNPFARSFRSAGSGLAQVDAPTGTLIAYATAPGRVAADGAGDNGLYTSELLKQMRVPGLSATEMFMRVRAEVMKQTSKKQVPWEASSLVGNFYFTTPRNADPTVGASAMEVKIDSAAVEQEYWNTIKSSTDVEDFRDYLKEYPTGAHVVIARSNLRRLEAVGKTSNADPTNTGGTTGATKTTIGTDPALKPDAAVKNQTGIESVFVAGTWALKITGPARNTIPAMLNIKQDGNTISGTMTSQLGESELKQTTINGGSFAAPLKLNMNGQAIDGQLSGTVDGETIKGTMTLPNFPPLPFTGRRNK